MPFTIPSSAWRDPFTSGVHQEDQKLPLQVAPPTLQPQFWTGTGGTEHGPLWFHAPSHPLDEVKSFWRWELKTILAGSSYRLSQQTLTIHLGLLGRSSIIPQHLIQLITVWWSMDRSAPLFTQVSKNIRPQISRYDYKVDHWLTNQILMYFSKLGK